MRFPWQKRAHEEHRLACAAREQLRKAEENWRPIHAHVAELREQKNLNGWTIIADSLFAGRKET